MTPVLPADAIAVLREETPDALVVVLELMYLVAKADGFVTADELRHFRAVAQQVSGDSLSTSRLSDLISSWKAKVGQDVDARLGELGGLLLAPRTRRAVYDLATNMVTADRQLGPEEARLMDRVFEALKLEEV